MVIQDAQITDAAMLANLSDSHLQTAGVAFVHSSVFNKMHNIRVIGLLGSQCSARVNQKMNNRVGSVTL